MDIAMDMDGDDGDGGESQVFNESEMLQVEGYDRAREFLPEEEEEIEIDHLNLYENEANIFHVHHHNPLPSLSSPSVLSSTTTTAAAKIKIEEFHSGGGSSKSPLKKQGTTKMEIEEEDEDDVDARLKFELDIQMNESIETDDFTGEDDEDEEELEKRIALSIRNAKYLFEEEEDSAPLEMEAKPSAVTKEEMNQVFETILGYEHDLDERGQPSFVSQLPVSYQRLSQKLPTSVIIPPVLDTTPVMKIPYSALDALKGLEDRLKEMKELKSFDKILSAKDRGTAQKELSKWKEENPSTTSNFEKQLALEIFTNALVRYRVSKFPIAKQTNSRLQQQASESEQLIPMDQVYSKLESLPDFNKYLTPSNTQSIQKTLRSCFTSASNAIKRFETSNKSAMEILEHLERILQEVVDSKVNQSMTLMRNYGLGITSGASSSSQSSSLPKTSYSLTSLESISARRDFNWILAKPYLKNEFGSRVPRWEVKDSLPFSFEDVRQSAWRDYELDNLKEAIVETVVQTKISRIKNRSNQLLMKFYNQQEKHPDDLIQLCRNTKYYFDEPLSTTTTNTTSSTMCSSINLGTWSTSNKEDISVKIVYDAGKLYRWASEAISAVKNITLRDIAKDSTLCSSINWTRVAGKLGKSDNFTNRSEEECRRIWERLLRPVVLNNYEWSRVQIKSLLSSVQKYGIRNWELVAKDLGSTFSSFQCFYTYKKLCRSRQSQRKVPNPSGSYGFARLVDLSREVTPEMTRGKYVEVATQFAKTMVGIPNTPNFAYLAEHYNRFQRPELIKGDFQVVEDLILFVCMVKMREYLKQAKTFAPLKNYLPWRYQNAWTVRAEAIFRPWKTAWTREEDLKLLSLVEAQPKKDWSLIATHFDVTKNRKNTRSRYVLLQEKLQTASFDEFREEYEKTAPRVRNTSKLANLLSPLRTVLDLPKTEVPTLETLQHPSEVDLWNYLSSFDSSLIQRTISDLEAYLGNLASAEEQVEEELAEPPPAKKSKPSSLCRTKFVRGDPQSTASAIHVRKLSLIPGEEADPVTLFESQVYKHFEYFKTRTVKASTNFNQIPGAESLMCMTEVCRIIEPPKWMTNGVRQEVDFAEIMESLSVPLNEEGFPILTEESKVPPPGHRPKTKKELRKDRQDRIKKLNQEKQAKKKAETFNINLGSEPEPEPPIQEIQEVKFLHESETMLP